MIQVLFGSGGGRAVGVLCGVLLLQTVQGTACFLAKPFARGVEGVVRFAKRLIGDGRAQESTVSGPCLPTRWLLQGHRGPQTHPSTCVLQLEAKPSHTWLSLDQAKPSGAESNLGQTQRIRPTPRAENQLFNVPMCRSCHRHACNLSLSDQLPPPPAPPTHSTWPPHPSEDAAPSPSPNPTPAPGAPHICSPEMTSWQWPPPV